MSKVAILSDIHANLPAFEAVLQEVERQSADLIVFGGDIVGYAASPARCVELVRALGGQCVFGNHESYLIALADNGVESLGENWRTQPVEAGVVHASEELEPEAIEWIRGLDWLLPIDEDVILAHAGLHDPNHWPYLLSEESAEATREVMRRRGLTLGFFGHTHRLAVYPERLWNREESVIELSRDDVVAITVGSVGQSREPGDPRATWVLFDSDERTVEFQRTEYDRELAARQIIDAGLPPESAARLLI